MTEEVPVKLGKTIGPNNHAIIEDPIIQPVWADTIIELAVNGGVVFISLGAGVGDFGNAPEVRPVARLRLPVETVDNIRLIMERIAAQAAQAKQSAN